MEKRLKACSFSDQPLPVGCVDQLEMPFYWLKFPRKHFYNSFGWQWLCNIEQCIYQVKQARFWRRYFMSFLLGTEPWTLVWFLKLRWRRCFATRLVCPLVCGCTHYCKYILALLCSVYPNFVPRIHLTSGYEASHPERFRLEVRKYWTSSLPSCVVFHGIRKGWKLKTVC